MDSPMKQRLIGAAVLVALAVIFLPMLVKGPVPDSGVSGVPLNAPDAPAADYEVRDLPLVMPSQAPDGGAMGLQPHPGQPPGAQDGQATLPTPAEQPDATQVGDTPPVQAPAAGNPDAADLASTAAEQPVASPPVPERPQPTSAPKLPASTAGGDYAVSFGSFTTSGSADKVIASLRAAGLPSYRESATVDRKAVQRVRIGPYATRADAEVARQQALRVRDDVNAQVVVLDAEVAPAKPATPATSVATTPTPASPAKSPAKPQASPAAASTGFAVQVGAFTKPADATALRDKLRAAGFSAFTEAVATAQGALTRVRAGPVATHAEADQLKAQLKAKIDIDGIVRPHP